MTATSSVYDTNRDDKLAAYNARVEKGTVPAVVAAGAPANHDHFPKRRRPLRPYPTFAKYNGGHVEAASSLSCAAS